MPSKEWRESPLHVQFKPGSSYMYSGEGFYYLQLVMEAVSGMSFDKLIENYVLHPLGMTHSQIVWKDTLLANLSYGHVENAKPRQIAKYKTVNGKHTLLHYSRGLHSLRPKSVYWALAYNPKLTE